MLNTINEALDYLYSKRNNHKDLSRIKKCINKLDLNPNYKIILIAGTNGKGSTANYIKNILKNTLHVGCFTSPYVMRFNERIMINDRQISDSEIMYYTNELEKLNDWYFNEYNEIIPFFELTLLMALMFYKDREIDLGIFECGIGGLNDSCNALNPFISIITSISYDHVETLGNTLEDILRNKLGIVRENKYLIYSNSDPNLDLIYNEFILKYKLNSINVYNEVKNISLDNNVSCAYKNNYYEISMMGKYQAYNAAIAIEVCNILFSNYPNVFIEEGLKNTYLPARLEIINNKDYQIIIDGAHNVGAINMLCDYLKDNKKNKKLITIFNCLNNKNYKEMLNMLDKYTDLYLFIDFDDERKIDINILKSSTNINSVIIKSLDDINKYLVKDNIILFTGSLHFASYIKNNLLK